MFPLSLGFVYVTLMVACMQDVPYLKNKQTNKKWNNWWKFTRKKYVSFIVHTVKTYSIMRCFSFYNKLSNRYFHQSDVLSCVICSLNASLILLIGKTEFENLLEWLTPSKYHNSIQVLPVQMDRTVLCLRLQKLRMILDDTQACRIHWMLPSKIDFHFEAPKTLPERRRKIRDLSNDNEQSKIVCKYAILIGYTYRCTTESSCPATTIDNNFTIFRQPCSWITFNENDRIFTTTTFQFHQFSSVSILRKATKSFV